MSKKDSKNQQKFMSFMFRGKEIFKPLNTGYIDEKVAVLGNMSQIYTFIQKMVTQL